VSGLIWRVIVAIGCEINIGVERDGKDWILKELFNKIGYLFGFENWGETMTDEIDDGEV
jgi:hypothetical protein